MRKQQTHSTAARIVAYATLVMFTWPGLAIAQAPAPVAAPSPSPNSTDPAASAEKTFSPQELEQLLAPIALYPDSLLAQTLMASTYPLEVVSAERWVKANPSLEGKALEDALQNQTWDASV